MWSIARRHNVRVADLVAWNRLDPELWLMPGQIIELHATSSRPASSASRKTEGERYVVRNGDNLWLIARRHGVTVADLRAWNGLDKDAWLMPGQILELRGISKRSASTASRGEGSERYVVRNGDSLWLIARRHSVSARQLALWNRLSINGILHPGQTLNVVPPAGSTDGETPTNAL